MLFRPAFPSSSSTRFVGGLASQWILGTLEEREHSGIAKVDDPGTWNVSTWKLVCGLGSLEFVYGVGTECGVRSRFRL